MSTPRRVLVTLSEESINIPEMWAEGWNKIPFLIERVNSIITDHLYPLAEERYKEIYPINYEHETPVSIQLVAPSLTDNQKFRLVAKLLDILAWKFIDKLNNCVDDEKPFDHVTCEYCSDKELYLYTKTAHYLSNIRDWALHWKQQFEDNYDSIYYAITHINKKAIREDLTNLELRKAGIPEHIIKIVTSFDEYAIGDGERDIQYGEIEHLSKAKRFIDIAFECPELSRKNPYTKNEEYIKQVAVWAKRTWEEIETKIDYSFKKFAELNFDKKMAKEELLLETTSFKPEPKSSVAHAAFFTKLTTAQKKPQPKPEKKEGAFNHYEYFHLLR